MSDKPQFPGSHYMRQDAPIGFGIRFEEMDDHSIFTCFQFDASKEGPPQHAHGGAVATVLDEAMGSAAFYAGRLGFTMTMTVNFRASAPLETDLIVRARVVGTDGKKTHVTAEMTMQDGTVIADSTGLFYTSEELRERIIARYGKDKD